MTSFQLKTDLPQFDPRKPILCRANVSKDKNDTFSLKAKMKHISECLVYGYASNENLTIPSNVTIPSDIKKLCHLYFAGKYPSDEYDDSFAKYTEAAKDEIVDLSMNILCNMESKAISLQRLVYLAWVCIDDPNDAQYDEHIDMEYFQLSYISLLASLSEITYFYDALETQYSDDDKFQKETRTHFNVKFTRKPLKKKISDSYERSLAAEREENKYTESEEIKQKEMKPETTEDIMKKLKKQKAKDEEKKMLHPPDYHKLIVKLSLQRVSGRWGLMLLYKLIMDDAEYYHIYNGNRDFIEDKYFVDDIKWYVKDTVFSNLEIVFLRRLLRPAIQQQTKTMNIDIDSGVKYILEQLVKCLSGYLQLIWIWLKKELDVLVEQKLSIEMSEYLEQLPEMIFDTIQDSSRPVYNGWKQEHQLCKIIGGEILYILSEKHKIKIKYVLKKKNFVSFFKFLQTLLVHDRLCIIVWRILNMEIDSGRLRDRENAHYYNWLSFIESNITEFKSNLICNINILKKKKDGDMEMARQDLNISIRACYRINQFLWRDLSEFNKLYKKIEKTKMIKPILEELKRS